MKGMGRVIHPPFPELEATMRILKKCAVLFLLGAVFCGGAIFAQYQTPIYTEQGGARQVIGSGGSLDVASGGEMDIESGGTLKIGGVAVTATAAQLNAIMLRVLCKTSIGLRARLLKVLLAVLGGMACFNRRSTTLAALAIQSTCRLLVLVQLL